MNPFHSTAKPLSLTELDLKDKNVLVRVDFNVPRDDTGAITDDTRIKASIPTIQYILQEGGRPILMSHLGRPQGKKVPSLSLAPCATRLSELLHKEVLLAPDCVGKETEALARSLRLGQILLLENLRFHKEEKESSPSFSKQLALLGDCYVNDAFGTAHRAHASTTQITSFFPKKAAVGFLFEKEIHYLGETLKDPKRPFVALLGGAKISTKLGIILSLRKKVDALLVGGAMAYTFFKAKGGEIGDSLWEESSLSDAKQILQETEGAPLYLPLDIVITDNLKNPQKIETIAADQPIPKGFEGIDIGPKTRAQYAHLLQTASTFFWNGPVGAFEYIPFDEGTLAIAQAIEKKRPPTSIIGGGDTIAALSQSGNLENISHVSTGGGAALKYIEMGILPAIEALVQAL